MIMQVKRKVRPNSLNLIFTATIILLSVGIKFIKVKSIKVYDIISVGIEIAIADTTLINIIVFI